MRKNNKHFYALAARMIRFLIVDRIRANQAQKRGSDVVFVELEFAASEAARTQARRNILTTGWPVFLHLEQKNSASAEFFLSMVMEKV